MKNTNKNLAYLRKAQHFADSGFSLIEMMISITIGLLIVAALVGVLTSNARNAKTNDRTAELQSNGRFALDHLKRELHHAGYRAYTWAEPNTPSTLPAITGECTDGGAAGTFVSNIRQGVWGANDTNPFTANCIPAANRVRGDVLVIRRGAFAAATSLTANTVYFRSSYAMGEVFQGTVVPAGVTGTPITTIALQEYVYYIGNDDLNATLPALRRVALQADGTMLDELVVSGIEEMQVQYGRYDTAQNTQYFDADAITGTATDAAQTQWDDVNSVRIWLLARNSTAETGYTNTNSYAMGDITYPAQNDNFRRQLFTAVVQLRN